VRWLQAISIYLHDLPAERVVMPSGRRTSKASIYDGAIRLAALAIKSTGELRGRDNGSSVGTPYSMRQLIPALGVSNGKAMDLVRWLESNDWLVKEPVVGANKNEAWERTLWINEAAKQAPPGWPLLPAKAPDPNEIRC
jgi:hypothetical protein